MTEQFSIVRMYCRLFIHSSVGRRLNHFQIGAIRNILPQHSCSGFLYGGNSNLLALDGKKKKIPKEMV